MIKSIILFDEEANNIVKFFHQNFLHIGMRLLQFEIERRGLFINKLTYLIKDIVENCKICQIHKLNKFIKPGTKQILSYKPLERVQADITYFSNKLDLNELQNKYLLNFTDHFSKFAKSYLINDKKSETIIDKFNDYLKKVGKPEIIHTDNGGEFRSVIFENFCKKNNIKIIHGSVRHPQSQGAVEKFNDNIISKIRYIKLERKKKFNINKALEEAINIYNNTTHSTIHIEPINAFYFNKKKDLNRIIHNTLKSQINENKDNIVIEKGSKALLCSNFTLNGKILNEKRFGKKNYEIPIIIENSIGCNKYSFKVCKNFKCLKKNKIYEANYKLIKFCNENVWNDLNNY